MTEDMLEIFISYVATPHKKGDVGEVVIASLFREYGFTVIRNIYIPIDNKFTEIDMVALDDNGVFVVECKNYSAQIIGDKDKNYWKAKYGTREQKFLNPLIQNRLHIEALRNFFPSLLGQISFNNIIVFNKPKCIPSIEGVYTESTLRSFLDLYKETHKDNKRKDNRTDMLVSLLRRQSDQSDEMRQLHIDLLHRSKE